MGWTRDENRRVPYGKNAVDGESTKMAGRPILDCMDGVKVAFGSRVEAVRQ